ncbi:MAG: phosphotransferase system enzyme I (PtsI) [Chlamydiales bacterium]|jgi:phosphotransferase system enzyme I (PtsI)
MSAIKGTPVSPGLAVAPVHVVRAKADAVPVWTVRGSDVDAEIDRLREAIDLVSAELERQQEVVRRNSGDKDAGILGVHRMILDDPSALTTLNNTVREERINAEAAVNQLIATLRSSMEDLDGARVRGYAADVSDPWRAVLDQLMAREREQFAATEQRVVLAAAELTPQVVTFLGRGRVLGIVAETGGRFSHGAVLARSFGIPCVVGLPNLMARLEQGIEVLIDGDAGTANLRPDQESIDQFIVRRQRRDARQEVMKVEAALPAVTPDGVRMHVSVNMESVHDLGAFDVNTCDGVGLLRTEFLYMERSQFPSEEEQFRLYRRVLEHMGDRPVTFRTLDIGGDKQLPYFKTPREENPALGWRGLRITLEWQDLLRVQMRAILRASTYGNAHMMLPMVTSLEEVRAAHRVFDDVRRQLVDQGYDIVEDLPVGIMVEVPSSILILDQLVAEVDFVSVGTNDLIQYLLAVDRDNHRVGKIYDPQHPAVVRALKMIIDICIASDTPCAVCGEIAGDYATTLLLMGLGYREVSLATSLLPEIRYAVRRTSTVEAMDLAARALKAETSEEIRGILDEARERLHERLVEAQTPIE